jgi:hypothetical protein
MLVKPLVLRGTAPEINMDKEKGEIKQYNTGHGKDNDKGNDKHNNNLNNKAKDKDNNKQQNMEDTNPNPKSNVEETSKVYHQRIVSNPNPNPHSLSPSLL